MLKIKDRHDMHSLILSYLAFKRRPIRFDTIVMHPKHQECIDWSKTIDNQDISSKEIVDFIETSTKELNICCLRQFNNMIEAGALVLNVYSDLVGTYGLDALRQLQTADDELEEVIQQTDEKIKELNKLLWNLNEDETD